MAIHDIPAEIWTIIASELDRKDLLALNKACHLTYNATLPILYSCVTPSPDDNYRFKDDEGAKYLGSLILGLLRHPEIRSSVKEASVRLCQDQDENVHCQTSWNPELLNWTEDDHLKAVELIRSQSQIFPQPERLIGALRAGESDACVTFALSMMPRASTLIIGEHCMRRSSSFTVPLIVKMGEKFRNERSAPLFGSLSVLKGCTEACQLNFLPDIDAFKALFYFPSLRTVSASVSEPSEFRWPENNIPVSSITSLTLRYSEIRPLNVQELIKATPGLTSFSFSYVVFLDALEDIPPEEIEFSDWIFKYGTSEQPHPSWPRLFGQGQPSPGVLDLSGLTDALASTVKDSLRSIAIRIETMSYFAPDVLERLEDLATGDLTGLRAFEKLETVDVPGHILCHGAVDLDEVLPSESLKKLFVGTWTSGYSHTFDDVEYLTYLSHYLRRHHPPSNKLDIGIADAFQLRDANISEQHMLMHIRFCKERGLPYSVHSEIPRNSMRRVDSEQWIPSFNPELRGLRAVQMYWLEKIKKILNRETVWEQGFRHVPLRDRQLFNYAAGLDLSDIGWRYVESDRAFERLGSLSQRIPGLHGGTASRSDHR